MNGYLMYLYTNIEKPADYYNYTNSIECASFTYGSIGTWW